MVSCIRETTVYEFTDQGGNFDITMTIMHDFDHRIMIQIISYLTDFREFVKQLLSLLLKFGTF